MINPNIASKVFSNFLTNGQNQLSIARWGQCQGIWARRKWRIIQEVGWWESNKEIAAKSFCQKGTVRNYLSTILAKLNLRDERN